MPIVLLIREDEDVHSVVLSEKPIIMGRSSSCDIKLTDEKVSSRHMAIKVNNLGRVIIKDLESTNGTFLNGSQIQDAYLMIYDQLMIGQVSLWLDEAQLNLKERKILTRVDEIAPVKFINLQGTGTVNPADQAIREGRLKEPLKKLQARSKASDVNEETDAPDMANGKDSSSALKERILKKSLEKKKAKAPHIEEGYGSEEFFELEKESGSTKMMKINKPEKDPPKKIAKPVAKKPVEKKKSLADKLLGIFRKES